MVKIILNSFLFWGGWIIIPFIMEIVPALGSVFLLIRRNLRHKLHKKELEVYPEITLIIPVYNSADTLYGCIRSINDSTYPNDRIRIFLVNNKGKDNSFDIYAQCQQEFPELLMQCQEHLIWHFITAMENTLSIWIVMECLRRMHLSI